ncbi:hypothetical protein [Thalassobellus suaedae]|uniref:Uncharacterized protein n=1 Tax=Thalassobellus suaedae TaxID=3074124 RepID=A0ABY9XU25_9FLAO|nr:hypothetical protein RHP51_00955 [Flavobacteriaceae bacterium HL-DH14]
MNRIKLAETHKKSTFLKYTIPSNTKLKVHKHLVIHAGVLTKEELINKFHYGKNKSNKPAEIIVFYASDTETPLTIIKNDSN